MGSLRLSSEGRFRKRPVLEHLGFCPHDGARSVSQNRKRLQDLIPLRSDELDLHGPQFVAVVQTVDVVLSVAIAGFYREHLGAACRRPFRVGSCPAKEFSDDGFLGEVIPFAKNQLEAMVVRGFNREASFSGESNAIQDSRFRKNFWLPA